MKLTKTAADKLQLPEGVTDKIFFDDVLKGFGLRLRAGGRRTWVAQFRVGSKQCRLTIGSAEKIDADQARAKAKEILARVQLGHDPQADRREARAPKLAELTVGDLVERYLPQAKRKLKLGSYSVVERHLRSHWQPLHQHEANKLERRHVASLLGLIAGERGGYAANRSRASLNALFSWAIGEGLVDANPVSGTNLATVEVARDRVLSDEEIAAIWNSVGDGDYGAIVHLLMLTGQRREEVGGMAWTEVDLSKRLWTIPGARTKNSRPHEVPLSAQAMAILQTRTRVEGRGLVFGSRGPFSAWSASKANLDGRAAIAPWRLHDLRRTAATRMADLGVQPHVIEAVLNHVSGHKSGVAGVYNRAVYAAEKRQALDVWGERIAALVAGQEYNVIPLRLVTNGK